MRKLVLFAVALSLSSFAYAEDKSDGCGLGWQVTKDHTLLATSIRETTNSFVPRYFGMTTGTLGCDSHGIAKSEEEAAAFAIANAEPLKLQMAEGQGEYVAGFARTLGCSDAVVPAFGKMTQDNFEKISNTSGVEMFKTIKSEINSNPALAAGCQIG